MLHTMNRVLCALLLSFALTACLPGKEKEKQVIAKAEEATETVQAEKIAADIANAAQKLLAAGTGGVATTTSELQTVSCDGKVFAFIPNTSKLAGTTGVLPPLLAQRMRNQLEGQFKSDNVGRHDDKSYPPCVTTSAIAVNSPVLMLQNTLAALAKDKEDDSDVVAIRMEKCPAGKPGVVVYKTYRGKPTPVKDERCGTAAPDASTLPSIALTSGSMPNWKNQLLGSGPATSNFSCFSSSAGCTPTTKADPGVKIVCDDKSASQQLIVNPEFDIAKYDFVPASGDYDCGKGWSGELISRVKKKQCKVFRDGKETTPTSVYDIAYVGAKCEKNDVVTESTCPATSSFPVTGRMLQKENLGMTNPVALMPRLVGKKNVSSIAYKRTDPSVGLITNMDSETNTLLTAPQVLLTASGTRTDTLFAAENDLSAVAAAKFDQSYVTEMRNLSKIARSGRPTCYTQAQDCTMAVEPQDIQIIVDRSQPMRTGISQPLYKTQTSCHATMANLFADDKRTDACMAAKKWQDMADSKGIVKTIVDGWNYRQEPVSYAVTKLNGVKATLSASDRTILDDYESTMQKAMINPGQSNKLLYGLAIGQDCNPPVLASGSLKVQADMYGSCMPEVVGDLRMKSMHGGSFKTCQTACPGTCVTSLEQDSSGKPLPPISTQMEASDMFMRGTIIPRLPTKAKVTYAEIIDEEPDEAGSANIGRRPMVLRSKNTASVDTINKDYLTKAALNNLAVKDSARAKSTGGNEIPLFQSIDNAIDRLRMDVLKTNPNAHASLIISGGKYDTECLKAKSLAARIVDWSMDVAFSPFGRKMDDKLSPTCLSRYSSPYFGRNVCEPEDVPETYDCNFCTNPVRIPLIGKKMCLGSSSSRNFSPDDPDLKDDLNGLVPPMQMNTYRSRANYCKSREYEECVPIVGWPCVTYKLYDISPIQRGPARPGRAAFDNENSLVGFLGRYFPNVKVFYMDMDGGGIGEMCSSNKRPSPDQPNGYFNNSQIFYGFDGNTTTDLAGRITDMVQQATGGGKPDPAVSRQICRDKFGLSVNIDEGTPPQPFDIPDTTFENKATASCAQPMLVDGITGAVKEVDKPMIPSASTIPDISACVNGVRMYSLKACP